jgi:hypothetical protein
MGEEQRQSFRRISREQMQNINQDGPEALFSLIGARVIRSADGRVEPL